MSTAGQNLKYLRKLRGWTQEEFAHKLNIKRSLIGAYEEERADPRIEVLEIVGEMFKLSLDELLLKDLTDTGGNYLAKRRQQKMMSADRNLIHFVPIKAAAGYLAGYADNEFIDELNTFTLPMLSGGHYRAFEIIGDSMLPTPSGSIIVGEKIEAIDDVKNNMPYLLTSHANPTLTEEACWDVAAYVNSQPRPHKDQSKDWPKYDKKPLDFAFAPYADSFSENQHKYGPYKAIKKFYTK